MTALDRVRTAMTLDDRLDDITQAHVWSRIEDTVGARRQRRVIPIIAAFAAAAAVVVILVARRGEVTDVLSAPANTTLSARLGPHTRAQLIGPARVEVVGSTGDATRLRLRTGTLVAEFTGGTGRSLEIEAPGATVDIVGTVFAVEVVGDGSCVSVSHGTVRVRPVRGAVQLVTTGQRWCTADARLAPIPATLRDVLEQHEVHTARADVAPRGGTTDVDLATNRPSATTDVDGAPTVPGDNAPITHDGASARDAAKADTGTSARDAAKADTGTSARDAAKAETGTSAREAAETDMGTSARDPAAKTHIGTSARDAAKTDIGTSARDTAAKTHIGTSARDAAKTDIGTSARDAAKTPIGTSARDAVTPHIDRSANQGGADIAASARIDSPTSNSDASPRVTTGTDTSPRIDTSTTRTDASPRGTSRTDPSPRADTSLGNGPPGMTPPVSGPDVLYETAERALAKHDLAAADRVLAQITDGSTPSALAGQALYDRARIAYQQHAWGRAQRQLDRLAALGASPLTEPGAYLGCRIALAAGDDGAERCFVEYRSAYPRSPHDLDVLGVLVDLAYRAGGCTQAASRREELVRRYPQSSLARGWSERCKEAR